MIVERIRIQRLIRDRRGQLVPIMAIMMLVLVAMAGLVIDGGRLYFVKQRIQSAADAGAIGGAFEIQRGNTSLSTEIRPAAINDTGLNDINDSNSTITVNNPPLSGPGAGNYSFVEVIVQQPVHMTFGQVFRQEDATVAARSVAGVLNEGDACLLTLNRTERAAFRVSGNPSIQAGLRVDVEFRTWMGL